MSNPKTDRRTHTHTHTYITVGYVSLSSFFHREATRVEIGNRKRPPKELLTESDHQKQSI